MQMIKLPGIRSTAYGATSPMLTGYSSTIESLLIGPYSLSRVETENGIVYSYLHKADWELVDGSKGSTLVECDPLALLKLLREIDPEIVIL